MKNRSAYTTRGDGRHFTEQQLKTYRKDLCAELRKNGQHARAKSFESMSLQAFGAQGGYVITKR